MLAACGDYFDMLSLLWYRIDPVFSVNAPNHVLPRKRQ